MKTISERREQLDRLVKDLEEYENQSCELIWQRDDVAIYRKTYKRDDYVSHVYTSTVHWTDDACSVTRQMKYKDKWDVAISYGSGGTLTSDPKKVATAMEQIFRLARKSIFELSKIED